jgi:hypothetical protein
MGTADAPLPPPSGPPGARAPRLMLSMSDVDFGTVNIGAPAATGIVVVMNTGDLGSGPLAVMVGASGDFQARNNCQGRRLGLGETCVVTLQFAPTSPGAKMVTGKVSQSEGEPMALAFTARGTGRVAPDAAPVEAGRDGGGPEAAPDAASDRGEVRPAADAQGQ